MKRLGFDSLRARLALLVLAGIVPALLLTLYTGLEQRRTAAARARGEALQMARLAASEHGRMLEGAGQLLRLVSQFPQVTDGNVHACSALLAQLLRESPSCANIGLIATDGYLLCSGVPSKRPLYFGNQEWFRRAARTRRLAVSDYHFDRARGKATLNIAYPVLDNARRVRAVGFSALDLGWLNRLAADAHLPTGSALTVIDRKGTILARHPYPEAWVGKWAPELPIVRAILTRRGAGWPGSPKGTLEAPGVDGVPRLYAFVPLGGQPQSPVAFVSFGIPTQVAFAEANQTMRRNLILLGLVGLLGLAAAWVGGGLFVVRPMSGLLTATKRLAAGDMEARTALGCAQGELGELARAFDEIAETAQTQQTGRKRAEEALRDTQDRYRDLVETISDWIWEVNACGVYTYCSPRVREILGYEPEEVLGKTPFDLMPPEEAERAGAIFRELAAAESPIVSLENTRIHKDGRRVVLETSGVPFFAPDGALMGYRGVGRDITQRKHAEETLARERDLLRTLIDNLPDYIYVKDTEGRFLLNNTAHVRSLGAASQEEVLGKTDFDFFPHELAARAHADEQSIIESGQPLVNRERSRTDAQGNITWIATTKVPWRDSRGRVVGIVGLSRDITERKRAEERIQHQLQRVQALRAIDQAINASLDLRLIFEVFLDQVTSRLAVDAAAVLVFDPGTQTLEYAAGRGFRSNGLERARLRLGEGQAGRAARERRMISVPDLTEAPEEFVHTALLTSESFVAYFALPLIAKGQVKGVLEIFHRARLVPDAEWLGFVETLAGQAAIAIDNAWLFEGLQRSNMELRLAYDTTLEGWSRMLDLRDERTEGHTQRVTQMTLRLARAMDMSEEELTHVRRGALLHDIGKMGVPDSILHKPGPLTEEEWKVMRQHPAQGCDTLRGIAYLRPALDIIYCHHERWDGTGYPRRLKGEQIPLAARIFSVTDAYDAMTSDRPYSPAKTHEEALAELRRNAGTQFDPGIVELFIQVLQGDVASADAVSAAQHTGG
jgi:PAS domain S-box-containing protein/putative nucleotidyltransferase with HDIG domain